MKKIFFSFILLSLLATASVNAQLKTQPGEQLPVLKLKNSLNDNSGSSLKGHGKMKLSDVFQVKKRKAVNMYFGAGYSFVIFTSSIMNNSYPVFNQSAGDFLSEINLFFGFAIAKAVTLEFEPSILFTNNNKIITFTLNQPVNIGGTDYFYSNTNHASMLAFPISVNARFFPFFKLDKSFMRLFFIGGGAGIEWIREEYDVYYSQVPGIGFGNQYSYLNTISTSQWAPVFRAMTGFTGSGGTFGFGGELRFNIVPLKTSNDPFATRYSKNFNSVDLALRFYFSL
jgi:hypothetical protein